VQTFLPDYVYRVSFRRYRPLNLPLTCKVVEKRCFGGRAYPRLRTCIFKSLLLPNVCSVLVEFFSASAEFLKVADEKGT